MTDNQSAIGEQDSTAPLTVVVSRRVRKASKKRLKR